MMCTGVLRSPDSLTNIKIHHCKGQEFQRLNAPDCNAFKCSGEKYFPQVLFMHTSSCIENTVRGNGIHQVMVGF